MQTGQTGWSSLQRWARIRFGESKGALKCLTPPAQLDFVLFFLHCSPTYVPSCRARWWWPSRSPPTPAHRKWRTTWSCWSPGGWTGCPASSPGHPSHWCCRRCRSWAEKAIDRAAMIGDESVSWSKETDKLSWLMRVMITYQSGGFGQFVGLKKSHISSVLS